MSIATVIKVLTSLPWALALPHNNSSGTQSLARSLALATANRLDAYASFCNVSSGATLECDRNLTAREPIDFESHGIYYKGTVDRSIDLQQSDVHFGFDNLIEYLSRLLYLIGPLGRVMPQGTSITSYVPDGKLVAHWPKGKGPTWTAELSETALLCCRPGFGIEPLIFNPLSVSIGLATARQHPRMTLTGSRIRQPQTFSLPFVHPYHLRLTFVGEDEVLSRDALVALDGNIRQLAKGADFVHWDRAISFAKNVYAYSYYYGGAEHSPPIPTKVIIDAITRVKQYVQDARSNRWNGLSATLFDGQTDKVSILLGPYYYPRLWNRPLRASSKASHIQVAP